MRLIGYGVIGPDEKYLEATLKEFKRLCDDAVFCLNNAGVNEKRLLKKYGYEYYQDQREWGKLQPAIKENLIRSHVSKLKPDYCLPLDADEVYDPDLTKEKIIEALGKNDGGYVFVVNLVDHGYSPEMSFWDSRIWRWDERFLSMNKQPVHCGMIPEKYYFYGVYLPIFLKHYGLKDKVDRERKAARYDLYDPEAKWKGRSYYDSLRANLPVKEFSDDVMREIVRKEVLSYGVQYKKIPMEPVKRFIYVRRKKDGYVFDMGEQEWQTLQEDSNTRNDFEYVSDVRTQDDFTPPPVVEDPLECKACGFIAKSEFGLSVHARKHAEKTVQAPEVPDDTGSGG